jgi:peptidoglycan/xylan/chitin deacetylase (PgdA/CDA1 family)
MSVARPAYPRTLPILMFHAIETAPEPIAFPPVLFERLLDGLERSRFQTLRLDAAISALQAGTLPPRAVVLTFDDGYRSVYDVAFPALARRGMTATVFLIAGGNGAGREDDRLPPFAGRPTVSWAEVREMDQAGLEIGAHTLTHPDLTRLTATQIASEVLESRARIEDRLGVPVSSFAYPFGRYDRRSLELARSHFAAACSDRLGLAGPRSDLHALERVETYYFRGERRLDLLYGGLLPWYLRLCNGPRQLRRTASRLRH